MTRAAPMMCWHSSWVDAVTCAARLTGVLRGKFPSMAESPPYRVRRRRAPGSRHDLWKVYTPTGRIPDRRPS